MKNKRIGYSICWECGDREYPDHDREKMIGITVMINQICPVCDKMSDMLIPRADFEGWGD